MNQCGAGLRGVIEKGRHLWGWINFGSHQIFEEATTYTALQFYSRKANDRISVVQAPSGIVAESPWEAENITLTYDRVTFGDRWLLVTGPERDLVDKLSNAGRQLDDFRLTRNIFVGVQTSADQIYQLKRLGPDRYEQKPPKGEKRGCVFRIEDEVMKPLISGSEAKRYLVPKTETYLLFPYSVAGGQATLIPATTMRNNYPLAWAYLRGHEKVLRDREEGKFNDNEWWRFGRSQNIGRQNTSKLIVPRLVAHIGCAVDTDGEFYLDNVDVGGVEVARGVSHYFLAAVINSPIIDFVFQRISKPFRGEFKSANRQFVAPLPIPKAHESDHKALAGWGERLQILYSDRRDALSDIVDRIASIRIRRRPDYWLFPNLPEIDQLVEGAPKHLVGSDRLDWANERRGRELEAYYATLEQHLSPGVALSAELYRGELRFLIDGIPAVSGIFPPPEQAQFILAQWHALAARLEVTGRLTGRKLATELRKVSVNADAHLMSDVIFLQETISNIETEIVKLARIIHGTA